MPLTVDVISDVICPWCYIGKRRLEKAIAALEGSQDVQVRWLPYQLNPMMPKEGMPRKEYCIKKFGSWEHSQELDVRIVAVGALEGLHFAFDLMERTPNTLDAAVGAVRISPSADRTVLGVGPGEKVGIFASLQVRSNCLHFSLAN